MALEREGIAKRPPSIGKLTGKSSGCSTLPAMILMALADATMSRMICDLARINPFVSSFMVSFAVETVSLRTASQLDAPTLDTLLPPAAWIYNSISDCNTLYCIRKFAIAHKN
ncbi:hypothetical protein ALC62_04061 [Cyphomyrmex costatus]|uniref:Uncharacterized protein n=1 Tax=Cyphomyrmex costatus TaxID=456900 RepID=A0A195CWL9_9HYME|nr:hypothetical protein ALC62_04061 [Cyphomyrmex costatus]